METIQSFETNIGKVVMKFSRRPFKSTFQKNTVKGVIEHPITGKPAYTFLEDDSYVEAYRCEVAVKDYTIVKEGDWIFTCAMQPRQFKSFDEPKKETDYDRSKFTDEEWERFSKFDDFETTEGSCHSVKNCGLKIISEAYAKWFIENKVWEHYTEEFGFDGYELKVKQLVQAAGIKYEGY